MICYVHDMEEPRPLFECPTEHGEGPVWDDRSQKLYWVDILQSRFFCGDPQTREFEEFGIGAHVGVLALRENGGLVIAAQSGFGTFDFALRNFQGIEPEVVPQGGELRFNDGAVDPAGRLFAGTMTYDGKQELGNLYRLDADHTWRLVSGPYHIPNGIVWSVAEDLMFYIDTLAHCVFVFEYDRETGEIRNRRRHIEFDAALFPDGMTRDEDDGLWIAFYGAGEVRRYRQDGSLDFIIPFPAKYTTSCCFGGQDMKTLFITTSRIVLTPEEQEANPLAGRVFALDTDYKGVAEPRFAG